MDKDRPSTFLKWKIASAQDHHQEIKMRKGRVGSLREEAFLEANKTTLFIPNPT